MARAIDILAAADSIQLSTTPKMGQEEEQRHIEWSLVAES